MHNGFEFPQSADLETRTAVLLTKLVAPLWITRTRLQFLCTLVE